MKNHQLIQELLPAVAMDVALPDEVTLVEQHLTECGDCRLLYTQMQETTDALATAVPLVAAPPSLRNRVLAIAADDSLTGQDLPESAPAPAPAPVVPIRKQRPNFLSWVIPTVAVAASVVLAIVAVNLSADKSSLAEDLADSRAQLRAAEREAKDASNTSVSLPTMAANRTIEVPGEGPLAGVQAFVAIQEGSDTGMLVLKDLPQPPHKHSWQTWVQHTDGTQSSVDVRKAGDKVVLIPIKLHQGKLDVEALMITTEPEGGSKMPTTDAIASARIV